jgi:hypothetical protein
MGRPLANAKFIRISSLIPGVVGPKRVEIDVAVDTAATQLIEQVVETFQVAFAEGQRIVATAMDAAMSPVGIRT